MAKKENIVLVCDITGAVKGVQTIDFNTVGARRIELDPRNAKKLQRLLEQLEPFIDASRSIESEPSRSSSKKPARKAAAKKIRASDAELRAKARRLNIEVTTRGKLGGAKRAEIEQAPEGLQLVDNAS